MTKENSDGTVTCVSGKDWMIEPQNLCRYQFVLAVLLQLVTIPLTYAKVFSSSCNVRRTGQSLMMAEFVRMENWSILMNLMEMMFHSKILEEKEIFEDLGLRLVTLPLMYPVLNRLKL